MATRFYNVEKVAELLGVAPAEVNQMRERQELHGYRDGANWKFKADEIDALAAQRGSNAPSESGLSLGEETPDDEDALLSEVELGQSNPSASGTVIGPPPADALGSSLSGFEDLDLTLAASGIDMTGDSKTLGGSEIDLTSQSSLDDDDLVLSESSLGTGSDLTIGGDSGISLLNPTDSGLSLEEPLDLTGSQESLVLADDVLAVDKPAGSDAPTALGGDSDFTLTPLDDLGDEDSSSQVIALDGDSDSSGELIEAPALVEADMGGSFGGMMELEEITSAAPAAQAAPAAIAPTLDYGAAQQQQAAAVVSSAVAEAPYSIWNILGLVFCTLVLSIIGIMMVDLMRNMFHWGEPYQISSSLMDLLLGR